MFAISYEEDFTLIGTTDVDHFDPGKKLECSAEEQAYLLNFVNQYFAAEDVVCAILGCVCFMTMGPVQPPWPRVITCCGWIAARLGPY